MTYIWDLRVKVELKRYCCCCYNLLLFTLLHRLSHLQCVRHYVTWNLELHLPNLVVCHPSHALGKKSCLCILLLPQTHVTSVNSSSSYPSCSQCMPYLKKVLFHIVFSKSREFRASSCLSSLFNQNTVDLITNSPKQNKCDSKEFDVEESSMLFSPSLEEPAKNRDLKHF